MTRTTRWTDRAFGVLGIRVWLWLTVAARYMPGVLVDPQKLGTYHDEHYSYMYEDVARRTILDFHQFPMWNPYACGGVPGLANPQGITLSPDFVLRLIWGVGPGRHLAILLFTVLAMEGVYRLARFFDASPIGAAFAGISWGALGWLSNMYSLGWLNQVGFQLLPWIVLGFEQGVRKPWWAVFGGFLVAWSLVAGGTYPVPHGGLILALSCVFDTARLLWHRGEPDVPAWWKPARSLGIVYGSALAFSAVKSIPMALLLSKHPRIWLAPEAHQPIDMLVAMARNPSPQYVGPLVFALAMLGLLLVDRGTARAAAIALFFFVLSCGELGPYAPWTLLRKLPVYSQLRSPDRFTLDSSLFLAVAAAHGLTRFEDLASKLTERLVKLRALGGILAGAFVVWALWGPTMEIIDTVAMKPGIYVMSPPMALSGPFRQSRGNRWDDHVWPPVNMGTLRCFEEIPFPQSPALRGDLAAEEYPVDPKVASVGRLQWTPNAIKLHVSADAATTIVVNQNWARGWSSSVGTVHPRDGLIAIDVPAGSYDLDLRFRDPAIVVGGLVTLLALAGCAFAIGRAARRGLPKLRDEWRALPWLPVRKNAAEARAAEDERPSAEPEAPAPPDSSATS